ncbi:hypothetical protein DPF_1268 [Desulfoplanes formicivorans]|uniref:Uncharacterized protein n=1 Tax=Desulfoplanes formicivorans TaxID=1592317 RepID=A0A194AHJ7_9BACT|nr:hypothetical protein DPF_1268 [Desulfoplanes formicivorans]
MKKNKKVRSTQGTVRSEEKHHHAHCLMRTAHLKTIMHRTRLTIIHNDIVFLRNNNKITNKCTGHNGQ